MSVQPNSNFKSHDNSEPAFHVKQKSNQINYIATINKYVKKSDLIFYKPKLDKLIDDNKFVKVKAINPETNEVSNYYVRVKAVCAQCDLTGKEPGKESDNGLSPRDSVDYTLMSTKVNDMFDFILSDELLEMAKKTHFDEEKETALAQSDALKEMAKKGYVDEETAFSQNVKLKDPIAFPIFTNLKNLRDIALTDSKTHNYQSPLYSFFVGQNIRGRNLTITQYEKFLDLTKFVPLENLAQLLNFCDNSGEEMKFIKTFCKVSDEYKKNRYQSELVYVKSSEDTWSFFINTKGEFIISLEALGRGTYKKFTNLINLTTMDFSRGKVSINNRQIVSINDNQIKEETIIQRAMVEDELKKLFLDSPYIIKPGYDGFITERNAVDSKTKTERAEIERTKYIYFEKKLKVWDRDCTMQEMAQITHDYLKGDIEMHKKGYIHADIKEENVMIHNGRGIVIDLGLSVKVGEAMRGGSLGNCPPEYLRKKTNPTDKEKAEGDDIEHLPVPPPASPLVDSFAMGVTILYQLGFGGFKKYATLNLTDQELKKNPGHCHLGFLTNEEYDRYFQNVVNEIKNENESTELTNDQTIKLELVNLARKLTAKKDQRITSEEALEELVKNIPGIITSDPDPIEQSSL